jgi:hypothetical protein
MSDLRFCRAILGKSEPWEIIPKCLFVDLALILWNQGSNWNFDDYTNRHIVVTGVHFAKFQNLSPPRPCIEICSKVDIIRRISELKSLV